MADIDDEVSSARDSAGKPVAPERSALSRDPVVSALSELSDELRRQLAQLGATHIGYDLPCRTCRYNLRTLSAAGKCPECGTPVKNSIPRDVLADPRWLGQLRSGAVAIVSGACLLLIAVPVTIIAAVLMEEDRLAWVLLAALLIGAAAIFIGGWRLTTPDHAGFLHRRCHRSRLAARVLMLCGVGGTLLPLVTIVAAAYDWFASGLVLVSILSVVAGAIGLIVELHYVEGIARRLMEHKTAERCALVRPMLQFTFGVFLFFMMASAIGDYLRAWPHDFANGLGCLAAVDILPLVGSAVFYLIIMGGFARQLGIHIRTVGFLNARLL